jgi:hypothetical protein
VDDPTSPSTSPRNRLVRALAALIVVLIVAAAVHLLATSRRWRSAVVPTRILFTTFLQYSPRSCPPFLKEAPRLHDLALHVWAEDAVHVVQSSILLGSTLPFEQRISSFRCSLQCDDWKRSRFKVTGSVFLRHDGQPLDQAEAIPMEHEGEDDVFVVPACRSGDVLFVILRLLQVEGEDSLDDPARIVFLRVLE